MPSIKAILRVTAGSILLALTLYVILALPGLVAG